jgi:transposase-like protein
MKYRCKRCGENLANSTGSRRRRALADRNTTREMFARDPSTVFDRQHVIFELQV